jgi:hypothetical protein
VLEARNEGASGRIGVRPHGWKSGLQPERSEIGTNYVKIIQLQDLFATALFIPRH